MAETYKRLGQGQVAIAVDGVNGRLYTCPSNTTAIIRQMTFTNLDSVVHGLAIYHIDNAGTAGVTNVIMNAANIAAGGWAHFSGTIILEADDELRGLCTLTSPAATDITYVIYGLELT